MVHLPKFTRLRQRVGLVDQKNDSRIVFSTASTFLGRLFYFIECRREQACHLSDRAGATGVEAERIKRYPNFRFPRDGVTKCLRQHRLSRSNIARKDKKRRAVAKQSDNLDLLVMMLSAPRGKTFRV